jgi:hypothetical protein
VAPIVASKNWARNWPRTASNKPCPSGRTPQMDFGWRTSSGATHGLLHHRLGGDGGREGGGKVGRRWPRSGGTPGAHSIHVFVMSDLDPFLFLIFFRSAHICGVFSGFASDSWISL